jgi:dienelactone hydrolase
MKRSYCFALSAFLVWGCHNQTSSSTNNQQSTISDTTKHAQAAAKPITEKGMTDTVYCTDDASKKYAVYLPQAYTPTKKWPIIYFFDPHGAGNFPLSIYKDLAEKYGYILAGTYESKNGNKWPETEKAVQEFMQDTWQRLAIDNSRIYVFGFSGGARVACSVALYDGGVTGVIACGGGFPEREPQIRQPFVYMGFVGDKDFNCIELKMLDKALDNTSLPHQLVVYHGKHQWPPLPIAEQGIQWMELNAMKQHLIKTNDSSLKAIQNEFDKELAKDKGKVQQYLTNKKAHNYLNGLVPDTKYASAADELAKSTEVKSYLAGQDSISMKEANMQREYVNHLSDKDPDWWQNTVKQWNTTIKKDTMAPIALQDQRLLAYMSLAAYMSASQAFNMENDGAAARFLDIYAIVDPTNAEHSYLYACIYARENNSTKAISSLQDALKLGFNDVRRMEKDSNFVSLRQQDAFKDIVGKMKSLPPKLDMAQ